MAGLCRTNRALRALSGRMLAIIGAHPTRCGLNPATVERMRGTLAHHDFWNVCPDRY
jgi:hypothetical protein